MDLHRVLVDHPVPRMGPEAGGRTHLDEKAIRDAKPVAKPYRLADGGQLFLQVQPTGLKTWRFIYRAPLPGGGTRPDSLTIGRYPEVALVEAREDAAALRRLLSKGVDPKKWAADVLREQHQQEVEASETFGVVAERFYEAHAGKWSDTHKRDVRRILDELIHGRTEKAPKDQPAHASIGHIPMRALGKADVRAVVEAVVARGALAYAKDVILYCKLVVEHFNSGTDSPIIDPTAGLRRIVPARKVKGHAALEPREMPEFLRSLRLTGSEPETRLALRLALLTAVRSGELREARWSEIDTEAARWAIPAERMKRGVIHEVPLSRQALATLDDLKRLTGHREVLFPSRRKGEGAVLSEATLLAQIKRAGYANRMTVHGIRSTFSTWAHDQGFDTLVVERCLAHTDRNAVRAAYDRGQRWEARMDLMQRWADALDRWEQGQHDEQQQVAA